MLKSITCKELKGACGQEIRGRTASELMKKCHQHIVEMARKGDQDHIKALKRLNKLSRKDREWLELDFINHFNMLRDAI